MFRENLRSTDRAARYGGEEMALILPETCDIDAINVAERFRARVAAQPFTYTPPGGSEVEIPVTISLGVAELPGDALTQDALVIAADQALYKAMRSGRNRVVNYSKYRRTTTGQLVAR